uniref:Uncharacterized protein n=1 Tax=Panagrolaimus superbus TaxID=310955 RepID=A0A914Z2K8_9BILA
MSEKTILCFTPKLNDILLHIIDVGTFKEEIRVFSLSNLEDILQKLPSLPLDTVIGVLFRLTVNEIKEKSKLAKLLEEYYSKHNIALFCCTWNSIFISSIIMACIDEHGIESTPDGIFCIITCNEDNITITHGTNSKNIPNDESLGHNYYHIFSAQSLPSKNIKRDLLKVVKGTTTNIFVTCQKELHLQSITNEQKKIQKLVENTLQSKTITIINKNIHEFIAQAICYKVMKFFNLFFTPFDVANNGFYNYAIAPSKENITQLTSTSFNKCLVSVNAVEGIPFYNMIICYEKFQNLTFMKTIDQSLDVETLENFSVDEFGTSLIISIDRFYESHLIIEKDNKQIKNGAIICLKEKTFSVEIIKDGELKDIGINKIPLEVTIADGQAYYIGEDRLKIKKHSDTIVIPDLLKIMTSNIPKISPKKGVKIVKDDDGKILLEFETYLGRRKVNPSFIFSLILKWSVRQAKMKLRQMPQMYK